MDFFLLASLKQHLQPPSGLLCIANVTLLWREALALAGQTSLKSFSNSFAKEPFQIQNAVL